MEQNLALGTDENDELVMDPMKIIVPVLLDTAVSELNKVRIVSLFVMIKNGISETHFTKLANHAQIEQPERDMILNLAHLGVKVISNVRKQDFS